MKRSFKTHKHTTKRERKFKVNKKALESEHPGWLDKYDWQ